MDNDEEEVARQPFPERIAAKVHVPKPADELTDVVWSELPLSKMDLPLELPTNTGSYDDISDFVETEIMLQSEKMRSDVYHKLCIVRGPPKEQTRLLQPEKHLRITLPSDVTGRRLVVDFAYIQKEPPRGMFTNYVFVFQRKRSGMTEMDNICLAYCKQLRRDGAIFALGRDATSRLADLKCGTVIFARPLVNCNMWKTHIRAIVALKDAERSMNASPVMKQLLRGRIDDRDMKRMIDIDRWINGKCSDRSINLAEFNRQQQRALALEAITSQGLVLIQGPPGTGKSHTICHGILPQAVARNERVLIICNSNVAVDSLMLKCINDRIHFLEGRMKRCGFKDRVSDEIVNRGLYVEGDISSIRDQYGNTSGANSNVSDYAVQTQIRSTPVIFTTIHFASKEKGASNSAYWKFDTLVLDEAAQIEDAKLLIVLARCPALKKIILVGDPKQLQPYVPDSLLRQNFGRSSMERVMDGSSVSGDFKAPFVMLVEQFRMAPQLRSVVSHLYYCDRLQDHTSVLNHGPDAGNVELKPLLVINVSGSTMSYSRTHHSYENRSEAKVVKTVHKFLKNGQLPLGDSREHLDSKDICILTPYNRHKDRLRMEICNVEEESLNSYSGLTFASTKTPARNLTNTPLASPKKAQALFGTQDEIGEDTAAKLENIDTVDKFQGSERNVVIISTCVHDKPRRAADPHFINVACSRAKHLLVIVGNFTDGLAGNSDWQHIKNQAIMYGSYIDHEVNEQQNNRGDEVVYNIDEGSLVEKLQKLLERPKKRGKIAGQLELI